MKQFLYDNRDEKSKRELYNKLKELGDGEYIVVIKKNRPIRSGKANSFYWVVINLYAIHTGHTKEEIDYMFRMARWWELITYPSGATAKIPKSTKDCDTKEFASVLNNLLQWGREEFPRVIIPRQDDLTLAQELEINNQYEKVFSGW